MYYKSIEVLEIMWFNEFFYNNLELFMRDKDCREKFQSSLHNSSSESFPVNPYSNAFLTLYEGCVDVRLQEDI
jgi:hypothetical protein